MKEEWLPGLAICRPLPADSRLQFRHRRMARRAARVLAIADGGARRIDIFLAFFRHLIQQRVLRRSLLGADATCVSFVQHHQIAIDVVRIGSVLHQQRQALKEKN